MFDMIEHFWNRGDYLALFCIACGITMALIQFSSIALLFRKK
jgi:hypothetical protein